MPLPLLSFFLLSWLYLWLRVDTRLIYFIPDNSFPCFSLRASFLGTSLGTPGGPSGYASAFLSQLFYYPWGGALVIAAVTTVLCACAGAFIAALAGQRAQLAHLLPGVLVLCAYGRYVHALDLAVRLLGAVALACAYIRIPWRNPVMRLAAFTALSAACYYFGGGVVFVFAALCGGYEVTAERVAVGAAGLAASAALPYVIGVAGFGLRLSDAYWWSLPYHGDSPGVGAPLLLTLYASVPLVAVIVTGSGWLRSRHARARGADGAVGRLAARLTSRRAAPAGRTALCVGAALAVWLSFDGRVSTHLRVLYLSGQRMWGELLEEAQRIPVAHFSPLHTCAVNRALYHEGRLLDDMFRYPQHPGGLIFTHMLRDNDILYMSPELLQLADAFHDLGLANDSAHLVQDAMGLVGARPWALKRLALSEGIKGRTEARELYLQTLRSDLIYGGWAARVLSGRTNDSEAQRREIETQRALVPPTDAALGNCTTEQVLTTLVEGNKRNRMAFEYLMAYYLLAGRVDGVAENLARLDDFGYARIPRPCEEAVMLYTKQTGKRVDLRGRAISKETILRFARLSDVLKHYAGDRASAAPAIHMEFPDTYFEYYMFPPSGEP